MDRLGCECGGAGEGHCGEADDEDGGGNCVAGEHGARVLLILFYCGRMCGVERASKELKNCDSRMG